MANSLELVEVIKSLREDLNLAIRSGEGHELRFNVDTIEVELQTAVEKEGSLEGGGKIKFWVLDIDGKVSGKYKKATTHKIKLNLTPILVTTDKNGNKTSNTVQINDKNEKSSDKDKTANDNDKKNSDKF